MAAARMAGVHSVHGRSARRARTRSVGRAETRGEGSPLVRPQSAPAGEYLSEGITQCGGSSSSGKRVDITTRAALEPPERYLWRFGYGRRVGAPHPRLELAVEGHAEEDGYTMYFISAALRVSQQMPSLMGKYQNAAWPAPIPSNTQAPACQPPQLKDDIQWLCRRRLCDLREDLHDRVKEYVGLPFYESHFSEAPFARHGGLPGTTARLAAWMSALAACANDGALDVVLHAYVLRFLHAPVPEESDAALLHAMGRCTVCTLTVETPQKNLCNRCLAHRGLDETLVMEFAPAG